MKSIKLILFPCLLFILLSCRSTLDCNQKLLDIQGEIESGNLRAAIQLADSLKKCCPDNRQILHKADSLAQIAERIGLDFTITEEQVITQIEKRTYLKTQH
jgi:hypothetical protein